MTKRKLMLVALSLCMVAILAMGGTLAYLTDDEAVKNTMTLGNLDITLTEYDDDGNTFDETKYTVIPGEQNYIDKNIVTTLEEGSTEAYVRTIILIECGDVNTPGTAAEKWAFTVKQWFAKAAGTPTVTPVPYVNEIIEIGGVYYCANAFYPQSVTLQPGESYTSLKRVWLDDSVTNEEMAYLGEKLNILAISQAVQATGNEVTEVDGVKTHEAAVKALDAAFGEFNKANVEKWFAATIN